MNAAHYIKFKIVGNLHQQRKYYIKEKKFQKSQNRKIIVCVKTAITKAYVGIGYNFFSSNTTKQVLKSTPSSPSNSE